MVILELFSPFFKAVLECWKGHTRRAIEPRVLIGESCRSGFRPVIAKSTSDWTSDPERNDEGKIKRGHESMRREGAKRERERGH